MTTNEKVAENKYITSFFESFTKMMSTHDVNFLLNKKSLATVEEVAMASLKLSFASTVAILEALNDIHVAIEKLNSR